MDQFKGAAEVQGDFGFQFECPHGHSQAFCLDVPHHELLFDSGIMSLERGAYREAVFSFAASRERFVELFVKVIAHSRGRDFESMETAWRALRSSSERQIGAFFWLGLLESGAPPEDPETAERRANFRNRVVHRGEFPSRQETLEYGHYVWELVRRCDRELKDKHLRSRDDVVSRNYLLVSRRIWASGYKGAIGGMTIVTALGGFEETFDASLARFRKGTGWATRVEDLTLAQLATRLGLEPEGLLERLIGNAAGEGGNR